jgi:hypothetical protein
LNRALWGGKSQSASSCSLVDVMESTYDRSASDPTVSGRRLRKRRLQAEAAVRPIMVVAVDEFRQDPPQVALADGNQVVDAVGGQKLIWSGRRDFCRPTTRERRASAVEILSVRRPYSE